MGQKVRHSIKFEHTDEEIFEDIDGDVLSAAIEEELPEDVDVGKCYCEYPKPYGHQPYVSVVTVDTKLMVDDARERGEAITDAVDRAVVDVVGKPIDNRLGEGWA